MPSDPRHRTAAPAIRAVIDFHEMPGARHFRSADLASWPAAQRRYRQLVQERHPDRQPRAGRAADTAQAEFIEITAAFKRLREGYRAHGTLPSARGPSGDGRTDRAARPAGRPPGRAPERSAERVPAGGLDAVGESRGPARTSRGRTVRGARPARDVAGRLAEAAAGRRRRRRVAALALAVVAALAALGWLAGALDDHLERANRDLERTLAPPTEIRP